MNAHFQRLMHRLRGNDDDTSSINDASSDNETSSRPEVTSTRFTLPITSEPPAIRQKDQKPPLAINLLTGSSAESAIDPQLQSPLFGRLPTELRLQIWRHALTRYENPSCLYSPCSIFARPGRAGALRVSTNLLLTCRAVYVEAYLVPFQVNSLLAFDGDQKDVPQWERSIGRQCLQCVLWDLQGCAVLKPWQLAAVSSVEMMLQQSMLEGGSVERTSRLVGALGRHRGHEIKGFSAAKYASFVKPTECAPAGDEAHLEHLPLSVRRPLLAKKITSLTIRLARTDWWSWETSPYSEVANTAEGRLRLEPMINTTLRAATSSAMMTGRDARRTEEGLGIPDFGLDSFEKEGRWGLQIGEYWPDLQTLKLVLETFAAKKRQLETVVDCAKLWTFPLPDGCSRLEWDGEPESTVWWRGGILPHGRRHEWMYYDAEGREEPVMKWTPLDDVTVGQQLFVMKTLVFRRRKVSTRPTFEYGDRQAGRW